MVAERQSELLGEAIDDACIGFHKRFVALARPMAEGLYDVGVEVLVAGEKHPEALPAQLEISLLLRPVVLAVATAVDGDDVQVRATRAQDALRLEKVRLHLPDLPAVPPVRSRLDRHDVVDAVVVELEVDALGGRFAPTVDLGAGEDRDALEEVAEHRLLLRGEVCVQDGLHKVLRRENVLRSEEVGVLALENSLQIEALEACQPRLVKAANVVFDVAGKVMQRELGHGG